MTSISTCFFFSFVCCWVFIRTVKFEINHPFVEVFLFVNSFIDTYHWHSSQNTCQKSLLSNKAQDSFTLELQKVTIAIKWKENNNEMLLFVISIFFINRSPLGISQEEENEWESKIEIKFVHWSSKKKATTFLSLFIRFLKSSYWRENLFDELRSFFFFLLLLFNLFQKLTYFNWQVTQMVCINNNNICNKSNSNRRSMLQRKKEKQKRASS